MNRLIFCFVGLVCSITAFGQGEANSLKGVPFKDRVVVGGSLGLSFSSYSDFFALYPQVGYMATRKLMIGTGLTYRYTKYKDLSPSMTFNDWGVNPFVRFTVYRNIFVQAEYEYLNYEDLVVPVTPARETVRNGFNSFLAGGGFVQPIGQKASFYIMAMYNFSYQDPGPNEYVPYNSPLIIRAGVNVGGLSF